MERCNIGIVCIENGKKRFFSPYQPIIPVFHYSNILVGVKRTLEWSKKYFEQRKASFQKPLHIEQKKHPGSYFNSSRRVLLSSKMSVDQGLKPLRIPSNVFVLAFHDKRGVFPHPVPKGFEEPYGRLGIDNLDENTMFIYSLASSLIQSERRRNSPLVSSGYSLTSRR